MSNPHSLYPNHLQLVALLASHIHPVDEVGYRVWPELLQHDQVFPRPRFIANERGRLGALVDSMAHQNLRSVDERALEFREALPRLPVQIGFHVV